MTEISPRLHMSANTKGFNLGSAIQELLPRGHVIHGFSSVDNERVIRILKNRRYSGDAWTLGYGVDGHAERALGRALLTYAMREQDGLSRISTARYPESSHAAVSGGASKSKFDHIVAWGDLKMYQDGDVVIARSNWGGQKDFGLSPLEVVAPDALSAIMALADNYCFYGVSRESLKRLPTISLE